MKYALSYSEGVKMKFLLIISGLVIICVGFLVIYGGLHLIEPTILVKSEEIVNEVITLMPFKVKQFKLDLQTNNSIILSLSISGGDESIYFLIKDYYGNIIFPKTNIKGDFSIHFPESHMKKYILYFNNSLSSDLKEVNLSVEVERSIPHYPVWPIIAGLSLAVAGSALIAKTILMINGK